MIKPPLKFVQVEWQVLFADVVIGADDSTLKQCPKGIDALSVNLTTHILASRVRDHFMRIWCVFQVAIAGVLIGRDQFNLVADSLADEFGQGLSIRVLDHFADDVPFARNCANYRNLASRAGSGLLLVPMAVFVFP